MTLANAVAVLRVVGSLAAIVPVFGPQLEALINVAKDLCEVAEGVQSNREGFVSLAHEAAIYAAAVTDSVQRSHSPAPPALATISASTNSTSPVGANYSPKHIEALTEILKEIEKVVSERKGKDAVRVKKYGSGFLRSFRDTVKKGSDQETLNELRNKLGLAVKAFSIAADVQGVDMLHKIVEQMEETRRHQERWLVEEREGHVRQKAEADKRRREEVLKHLDTKLMPVHDARYDSNQAPSGCMANTRVKLLADLESWIGLDGERIYWLSGLAGTGKSAVARSFCSLLADSGLLAGSFFVSRSSADRRDARSIVRTLAFQLALHFPAMQENLHGVIVEHPDTLSRPVGDLIIRLIVDPLAKLVWSAPPPLIVIDAFDECDMQDGREGGTFLPQLLAAIRRGSLPLRLFVTSRPHPSIKKMFTGTQVSQTDSYLSLKLHEIETSVVQRDIELYFETSFRRIARTEPELEGHTWPEPSTLKTLVARAGVLFIYAATVVRYVGDPVDVPSERLRSLLTQGLRSTGLEYEILDDLYLQILRGCVGKEADRNSSLCVRLRMVAGSLVHLQDPLSLGSLSALLNAERAAVRRTLESLSSLLIYDPQKPVQLFHPSFPDFIGNADRCRDLRFRVVAEEQHTLLALRCLSVMNQYLKYDICDIRDPSLFNSEVSSLPKRLTRDVPAELAYACKHWMKHISQSSVVNIDSLVNELRIFALKHLLHWVEALSLLMELPCALNGLSDTIKWCRTTGDATIPMASLLSDAERAIQEYYTPISTSALQIYHSALVFMPHCSLHQISSSISCHTPQLYSQRHPKWSALLRVLEDHENQINSVAYSRDGASLASGSDDTTVRVWDMNTGDVVTTLNGHDAVVNSVAFSPNGTCLASGSDDGTVRMWDINTCDVITTLSGHAGNVRSVEFSPDGTRLASGSNDMTVRVWDVNTGDVVTTLNGHNGVVSCVAFSPDGIHLASGSEDMTVRVWNTNTGDAVVTLNGSDMVRSVAFSPDGTRLASGSDNTAICVWDMNIGGITATLSGHDAAVHSVAFSPDGKHLISGSSDTTARVWDMSTGNVIATLSGHTDWVRAVAFSPDMTRLASGSDDMTVQVWDANTADDVAKLIGHDKAVYSMAFSPNKTRLASGSGDATVYLWDVTMGYIVATLKGHNGTVYCVEFSPDGTRLASGSDDNTARIWDVKTGNVVSTLNGHYGAVRSVAFSPDGLRIASGSTDTTACVWDVNTGDVIATLSGHSRVTYCVTFSPDGNRLASGSFDRTVRVWDLKTGDAVAMLSGHTGWVRTVAFSPDGSRLASGSSDTTVRVWDVNTSEVVATLNGHTDWVFQVSWSFHGLEISSHDCHGVHRTWHAGVDFPMLIHASANGLSLPSAPFTFSVDQQTGWASCSRTTENFTKRVCWVPTSRRPTDGKRCLQAGSRIAMGAPNGTITFLDLTNWLSTWMSV